LTQEFEVKDSGNRQQFDSGMVRDTTEGKINFLLIRPGPMFKRWAEHLSKAAAKYDNTRKPGEPRNWQLAEGLAEYERFQESAARHFELWLAGEDDEDHAAGVFFNVNGAEYVKAKLKVQEREEPPPEKQTECVESAGWEPTPGYEDRWHPYHLSQGYCVVGCPGCDRGR
jgi:hypothetical protein